MATTFRRWSSSVALVVVGVALGLTAADAWVWLPAGLLVVYGGAISPAFFPRSADLARARAQADDGSAPLVLWKPGCIHCVRLRAGLVARGARVSWVDSSLDCEAEQLVRSVNGGDHTTPTVVFRGEARTNPDTAWVRSLAD